MTRSTSLTWGLIAPDGSQVGASGSDKTSFFFNGKAATPGYHAHPLTPRGVVDPGRCV